MSVSTAPAAVVVVAYFPRRLFMAVTSVWRRARGAPPSRRSATGPVTSCSTDTAFVAATPYLPSPVRTV